jgi:riboflavin kinase/FMN adenylyltransferase
MSESDVLDLIRPHRGELIAAIGVFDGVHLGHRTILREMVVHARSAGLLSVAVTFEPHPDQVLGRAPGAVRLSTPAAKAAMIRDLGVDLVLPLAFDREFASLTAQAFVQRHLVSELAPRQVYVGFNFTFGQHGSGTASTLTQLGAASGFAVRVFSPQVGNGGVVSSTKIRSTLATGDVAMASRLLGRPYRSSGVIVRGDHRGSGLGFPTANVALAPEMVIPKLGVYAGWASVAGRAWPAVANIGRRPTFAVDGQVVLEVHLIGYPGGQIYGQTLEFVWIARLRDEQRFEDAGHLCQQIAADCAEALRRLRLRQDAIAPRTDNNMC